MYMLTKRSIIVHGMPSSYVQSTHEQGVGKFKKSDTVQLVFGSGLHRKLVVSPLQQSIKKGRLDNSCRFTNDCIRSALL